MRRLVVFVVAMVFVAVASSAQPRTPSVPTPEGIKPGSITCEDVPYPFPVSYLPLTLYGQDVRIAFMDVPPVGQPNGHVVVLFHGNNFAGFYFGPVIDVLRKEGFRVIAPDQIGYGRSSKPIIPYNFHDWARNTRLMLYNPIGLVDPRYGRPWDSTDEAYKRTLASTYQNIRASIMRYVAHNPA